MYNYPDGFRIFFKENACEFYDTPNELFEVTCFLSHNDIKRDKLSLETKKLLEEYSSNKKSAYFYILGKSQRRTEVLRGGETKDFIVISQESARDIVLRDTLNHCEKVKNVVTNEVA